jgi:hypothetical protein
MAIMASIGVAASPFLPVPERANVIAGILTLYLVWSGWAAVRSKQVVAGRLDMLGLGVALTSVATGVVWAIQAANSPTGTLDDTPPQAFYVFILIGTFASIGDARLIMKGRVSGASRLSRHLWRMCVALFIASGSFFLGQQRVMPVWMQGSPWLFVPTFAPPAVMAYYLVATRVRHYISKVRHERRLRRRAALRRQLYAGTDSAAPAGPAHCCEGRAAPSNPAS